MIHRSRNIALDRGSLATIASAVTLWTFCGASERACLAQGTAYRWTGPPGVRIPSGNWSVEGNWSPSRGVPNSFSDTATIDLIRSDAYEVRVDRDMQVGAFTLDSAAATLLPTGLTRDGRSIELAPSGTLRLLSGRLTGDLSFQMQSGNAELGDRLIVQRGGRADETPRIVARGPRNFLSTASAQIGANAPAIAVLADALDAGLTLEGEGDSRPFHLLSGAAVMLDAARGNTAMLAAGDRPEAFRVVNSGAIATGGTLPHEGRAVLALALEQSPEGLLEVNSPTTLGTTRSGMLLVHRNHGTIVLNDETLTVAPSNLFINSEQGVIGGLGTIVAMLPIANFGTLDPDVAIEGSLVSEATAMLDVGLGGYAAGVNYDRLVVTGNVTLGGTLRVELARAFSPQIGDSFQIISAGNVSGRFHQFLPPPLPADKASLLVVGGTGVSLAITEPEPVEFASSLSTSSFADAFGGAPPQSNWAVDLVNVSGDPQEVIVTPSAATAVQGIHIAGGSEPQASMTLSIEENAVLAASSAISVGPNGQLALASGSGALAPSFEIDGGSLSGGGTLFGNVTSSGHVSPGGSAAGDGEVGSLTIDGDFVHDEEGVLEIDVFGVAPGEHDVLHVSGDLSLAGNVVLDFFEFEPTSSFTIGIIDGDGTPVTEEPMCNVLGNGKCVVMVHQGLGPSIQVLYFLAGDFNQDGSVDRHDLAVWQMNAGFMGPQPPPSNDADADNDGDVDGDDLLAVLLNFGQGGTPMSAASVPEPACLRALLVCLLLIPVLRTGR